MEHAAKAINEHGVVPDVISEFHPSNEIHVDYGHGHAVKYGNELTVEATQKAPAVCWDPEADSFYTLVMTDPGLQIFFALEFRKSDV
ncbi:hypothetical protein HK102_009667, partial [Quaeritorhiza haematococci]